MDEPIASLDVAWRDEVLRYSEILRNDLCIVYVSHSVAEITRLADTIVLLSEGKAIAVGGLTKSWADSILATADRPLRGGLGDRHGGLRV
jgi:molybdate transport system ATP-binding protein